RWGSCGANSDDVNLASNHNVLAARKISDRMRWFVQCERNIRQARHRLGVPALTCAFTALIPKGHELLVHIVVNSTKGAPCAGWLCKVFAKERAILRIGFC